MKADLIEFNYQLVYTVQYTLNGFHPWGKLSQFYFIKKELAKNSFVTANYLTSMQKLLKTIQTLGSNLTNQV